MMTEDITFAGYGLTICIVQTAWKSWQDGRQLHPDAPELCGILIGSCEKATESCRIELITTPGKRDIQYRSRFVLKDPCHQKAVDLAFHRSEGCLGYLGTWHTHPEEIPTPSTVDINDWVACAERNPDRQLYFVIVGTLKTCVFIKHDNQFKMLNEYRSSKA